MTALVGREVKRTLSTIPRKITGLPGDKTLKAEDKDLRDLVEPITNQPIVIRRSRHFLKMLSPKRKEQKNRISLVGRRKRKQRREKGAKKVPKCLRKPCRCFQPGLNES